MAERTPVIELLDPRVVESLRKKTPIERLEQAFGMWDFAIEMMNSAIRQEHPEWSPVEIQREIFRRVRGTPMP